MATSRLWLTMLMAGSDQSDEGSRAAITVLKVRGPRWSRTRDPKLEELFGDPLPEREAAMWSLLDETQRARALQRARSLMRWQDGNAGIPARQAAADAGVTLVRFYQMNAAWRQQRSLATLGVGAAPERERRSQFRPEVNAVLQSAVAEIVDDADASVRSLALRLADVARERGVPGDHVPGHNTLRSIVERARRDRRREQEVGNALLLDHAACGLQRLDGAPWTVFVIADAASQLILGATPGEVAAGDGYSDAARDALRRLRSPGLETLPWADRLARVQIVPGGLQADAMSRVAEEAAAVGVGWNVASDRKAGRYLEQVVGRGIGVLPIWPGRVAVTSLPDWAAERAPLLDLDRARARITLAVDDYNSERIAGIVAVSVRSPPPELAHMLGALAG